MLKVQTTYSPYDEFIKDMSNKSYFKMKICTKCHPYAEIIKRHAQLSYNFVQHFAAPN